MSRRNKSGKELCVYCVKEPATTEDHVIARSFFPDRQYPPNIRLPKVPACPACNHKKSQHEDALRDFLCLDLASEQSPEARALFNGAITRSIQGNHSEVARAVVKRGQPVPLRSPGGLYAGTAIKVPLDGQWNAWTLAMIIRGLYYDRLKQRLPADANIPVERLINPQEAGATWQQFLHMGAGGLSLGKIFSFLYFYADADPTVSIWLLLFYESILFWAPTNPPVHMPPLSR